MMGLWRLSLRMEYINTAYDKRFRNLYSFLWDIICNQHNWTLFGLQIF